jgi:hypothetical protein
MTEYGDLDHVRKMLRPTATDDLGADDEARLTKIQAAISAMLEYELGRSFGVPAEDTTVTAWAGPGDVLLLPRPARAITTVTVGGTVAGGTVTGGTAFADDYWAHHFVDPETGFISGLRLLSGASWGDYWYTTPVVIEGDFSDSDDDTTIPADLQYAVSWIIAERFKQESASPAGFIGPDGSIAPFRKLFDDEFVKPTLDRYRVASRDLVV